MRATAYRCCLVLWLIAAAGGAASPAPAFQFGTHERAALDRAMPELAARVFEVYREPDRRTYLDNEFRLEIVAKRYAAAATTLAELRRYDDPASPRSSTNYSQYLIYVRAKRLGTPQAGFDAAFVRAFREIVDPLDDRRAAFVVRRFKVLAPLHANVEADLARLKNATSLSLTEALALVRDYQNDAMYRQFAPQAPASIARDDRRRYLIDQNVSIAMPDGRFSCAFVVRPRHARTRLPALLEYSIYADRRLVYDDARLSAAFGYAGVRAYTPGTACSTGPIVPYVGEGAHADAAIEWIARQPWSDGRVGMYGGSYNSFAQWAAAKHRPRALRALMLSVANAPGIDTPMEGNVFESWVYPWPHYVTAGRWLDASSEGDPQKLVDLERRWYVSGQPYRAMSRLSGTPNPIWDGWLDHPSYDAFWQSLVPFGREFAAIDIPVLFTDGYLSGQNVGGYYYYAQYRANNPAAPAYLVLGPYDHLAGQFGTVTSLGADADAIGGIPIDSAAHIDIESLRYQWFDHVFKGARKPAILAGYVNYEVMHGNRWEHEPSIDAMRAQTMRIDQGADRVQTIDFRDRSDVDRTPPPRGIDTYLGFTYESGPLAHAMELNGVFSGVLDFVCNKRDFDFDITLFGLDDRGQYEEITNYMARASYVSDRTTRHLLQPGARTRLPFTSSRITSWRLAVGSRIVVLVNVIKDPGYPINYGTGGNVADESIADAGAPLQIRWFGDSFVALPMRDAGALSEADRSATGRFALNALFEIHSRQRGGARRRW